MVKETIKVNVDIITNITKKTLIGSGYSQEDAEYGAKVLIQSDLRGVNTHGINNLKLYTSMGKNGVINQNAKLTTIKETSSTLYLDAQNGLGIAMAARAIEKTIEKAKKNGVCVTSIKNSGHLGMTGYYTELAALNGCIGISGSATASCVAPFGGSESVLGNSPISIAFPGGNKHKDPIILDMACSAVTFSQCRVAAEKGESVPEGWLVDSEGLPCTDPTKLLNGTASLVSFGGVKGYVLNIMGDMLSSVLSGSNFSPDIGGATSSNPKKPENMGHFMVAIDVEHFRPLADINESVDDYVDLIKNSAKAKNVKEIYMPGEIEAGAYKSRVNSEFEIDANIIEKLRIDAIEDGRVSKDITLDEFVNMHK